MGESGSVSWEKTLGGSSRDYPLFILPTTDDQYWVAGYTSSSDGHLSSIEGGADYWVLRLDSTGNILWNQTYGGNLGE